MSRIGRKAIFVTVTEAEYAAIHRTAQRRHLSVAALMRHALNALDIRKGDELVWLEDKPHGRPPRTEAQ